MLLTSLEMKLGRYQEKLPRWRSVELSKARFVTTGVRGVIAWLVVFSRQHFENTLFLSTPSYLQATLGFLDYPGCPVGGREVNASRHGRI
jgi:hypothetical protein